MSNKYTEITHCRCCFGTRLHKFIDLGTQPLANSYHGVEDVLDEYPLAVNVCLDCWHTQLTVVVDPDELFKHYLYVSGTTNTLHEYFEWFATNAYLADNKRQTVLDIACNDGTQLDYFKKLGYWTLGVDPAKNLVPIARNKGHVVFERYWDDDAAEDVIRLAGKMDVIIAQNVFAHTHDIYSFLQNCKRVMHPTSTLYIQTSQSEMYRYGEFDTIYHEHLSFFNTKSMKTIVERAGLHLNEVFKTDIHGTSYVFVIGLDRAPHQRSVNEQMDIEARHGLYNLTTYHEFGENADTIIATLSDIVKKYQMSGLKVIGYGAAAKGMTVLNAGKIQLDYIVDDNPLKQGLFTPGMDIHITSSEALLHEPGNLVILPLAWNFFDEIKKRVRTIRPDKMDIFVKYFPELVITG